MGGYPSEAYPAWKTRVVPEPCWQKRLQGMPVNFSPHRKGSSHIIDRDHVVLLRGTPIYDSAVGTIETRICVGANGWTQRAMWLDHNRHVTDLGLQAEFHLWQYYLSARDVNSIREALTAVYRQFSRFESQPDANDSVDSLTFWAGDDRFSACLLRAPDLPDKYTSEQFGTFLNACNRVYGLAPQPANVVEDWVHRRV